MAAPRAAFSFHGGFEGHARDLSVVFVELPLIVLGGALIPLFAWVLTIRWVRRPWFAVAAAVAALTLGLWGGSWSGGLRVSTQTPGYGPGL